MSNALDAFRAQREAVERVHTRLMEVGELLQGVQSQVDSIAQNQSLREVLREEQRWLERAERTIADMRSFREEDMRRFWPGVWRRWAVALVFALAAATAFGGGHVWASRPYQAELASLRSRLELLDFVAQRVITMTPSERRQFDALMKGAAAPGR
jgi:hypothetical protein